MTQPIHYPFYFAIDGLDGTGKTTQLHLLEQAFQRSYPGIPIVTLRLPGNTAFGNVIREAMLRSDTPIDPVAELLAMLAAGAQLTAESILPALSHGKIVLTDRSLHSAFAYQYHGRELRNQLTSTFFSELVYTAYGHLVPYTIVLDISSEERLARLSRRNQATDRFESADADFQQRVREGFLGADVARVLKAEDDVLAVHTSIVACINSYLADNHFAPIEPCSLALETKMSEKKDAPVPPAE